MFTRRFVYSLLLVLCTIILLAACAPLQNANESGEVSDPPEPTLVAEAAGPQEVTETFYQWYLDTIGDRGDGEFTNPLTTGLYRDSEYLTADFIAQIDEILAGFSQGGYDPILQAQDIPERITVQEPNINGDQATVIVLRYWGGNPDPSPMTVHLRRDNEEWRINNVTAFEIPAGAPPPETAAQTVSAFYDWYLDYIGDPATDDFRNPLVDQAYRQAPYLTTDFVQHIDELLAEMREEGAGGYDPLLCAQAIPIFINPNVTFQRNEVASVLVRSSFPNHLLTVDLRQDEESWVITNITCTGTPEGSAKAFYTWYLGYIGDRFSDDFRNPLVEQAYHDHLLLTEEFVNEVDETLAGFQGGGFDPFLLAQDIPQDFSVDPGVEEGTAVVHLPFSTDCVRHLLVSMEQVGSLWKITDIQEAEGISAPAPEAVDDESVNDMEESSATAAATYVSEAYGFTLTFPETWFMEPLNLEGPGMPDDWPVAAAWLLMPPDVAAQLSTGGPPDPNAPVIVAPLNIEVVVGTEADLDRVYGPLDGDGETRFFNDYAALNLWREPGYTHVIFAHPTLPETWIVVTDWVTEFPGREAQAEVTAPVLEELLNNITFDS